MNAILGSGVLGLPFSVKSSGITLFLFLLIAMALVADYAIHLLLCCSIVLNKTSYRDVGEAAYGDLGYFIVTISVGLQNLGAMTSYLTIAGSTLPTLLQRCFNLHEESIWVNKHFLLPILTLFIIYPLACLRVRCRLITEIVNANHAWISQEIGKLGYISTACILVIAVFSVAYVAIMFALCKSQTCLSREDLIRTTSFCVSLSYCFALLHQAC